jgi:hypothetical protein
MRATLFVFAVTACAAWGQDVARVFHFHHVDKTQDLSEVATMIRTIADVRQLTVDPAQKSMTLSAPAGQIQIAEWLFNELDRTAMPAFASKEFHVSGDEDVVRIFFAPNAGTIQSFQEIATSVRTVAEIRRLFTYNSARAMAVRGTADQIAAAEFLIRELDQPKDAKRSDSRVHEMIDTSYMPEPSLRVFCAPASLTVQQFQEMTTLIRTIVELRRVFTYNEPRAIVLRGAPDTVAAAGWILHELKEPVTPAKLFSDAYDMRGFNHEGPTKIRIFYVKDAPTTMAFQQIATQLRAYGKVFTYDASRAIALRGSPEQIEQAEQILKDRQVAQGSLK